MQEGILHIGQDLLKVSACWTGVFSHRQPNGLVLEMLWEKPKPANSSEICLEPGISCAAPYLKGETFLRTGSQRDARPGIKFFRRLLKKRTVPKILHFLTILLSSPRGSLNKSRQNHSFKPSRRWTRRPLAIPVNLVLEQTVTRVQRRQSQNSDQRCLIRVKKKQTNKHLMIYF